MAPSEEGERRKRQRVEAQASGRGAEAATAAGNGHGASGTGAAGGAEDEVRALREGFAELRRLLHDGKADWGPVRERTLRILRALVERHGRSGTDGGGDLDDFLKKVLGILQRGMDAAGEKLDLTDQLSLLGKGTSGAEGWKDLVSYAHKLSFTTFAPPNFVAGDPRWGVVGPFVQPPGSSTGFWHFSPPAPQKWHLDASVLYDYQAQPRQQLVAKSEGEAAAGAAPASPDQDKRGAATGAAAGAGREGQPVATTAPEEKGEIEAGGKKPIAEGESKAKVAAGPAEEQEKKKEPSPAPPPTQQQQQNYNPLLSNMVDFVLNPDLEVADLDEEEDEMSESSD